MKLKSLLLAMAAVVCSSALFAQNREKTKPLTDEQWMSLAPTPPMGWNSWNKFGCNVSENLIKDIADAMVSSGMKDAGYEYVVIDDCWQIDRDENGVIVCDPERFPNGMKAVADYVHGLGLKFGIYSCAGTHTCQGRPGSMGYQFIDAKTYAEWGVDYLKYDWCDNEGQNARAAYLTMANAIKATGHPIVFSICEWGENQAWEWGKGIGHLWRVTPDIRACYDCKFDWGGVGVLGCIDAMAPLHEYAGPGHWNDAEMLEVGNGEMTKDEQISHFAMWCMLAAPLMSGNDLRDMSLQTIEILTNKEAIAVNQDPLGKQAVLFMDMDGHDRQIWAKPLANGEIAVCFLNRGRDTWNLDYNWLNQTMYFATEINFRTNEYNIRDLWAHKDLGTSKGRLVADINPHGCLMVRLSRTGM
ncbi:MAG: glycoside hydrolase family 27 protein [Bacteroidales bacterium]|nr:glycoside hydrolase family 27 protein [Bacteroidales bacterium]